VEMERGKAGGEWCDANRVRGSRGGWCDTNRTGRGARGVGCPSTYVSGGLQKCRGEAQHSNSKDECDHERTTARDQQGLEDGFYCWTSSLL
jgi:hypothetical protein